MKLIGLFAVIGVLLSAGAHLCAERQIRGIKGARLFGKVPWSIVGVIGYVLIFSAQGIPWLAQALAVTAVLITPWLIHVAVKVKLACPLCMSVWVWNIVIAVCSFTATR